METMAATGANNGSRCPKRCTATNQERPAAKAVWTTGTATLRQQLSRRVRCSPTRDRVADVIGMPLGRIGRRLGSGRVRRTFFRLAETAIGPVASYQRGVAMTIVMVHGAWADGSSWSGVIRPLQAKGFRVVAAPIPLTSLSDDVKALDRLLDRTRGPVVLASHAYAGAVISATANVRVKSLVYVAGLTPAEGETVAEVFYREKPHALAPRLAPDASGIIWMPDEGFGSAFAPKASPQQIALLNATQRPIAVACIQERSPKPAWMDKRSWYLIAEEDRMIPLATQRYLARRMKARVRSEKLDHTPLVTAPDTVVEVILEAVSE